MAPDAYVGPKTGDRVAATPGAASEPRALAFVGAGKARGGGSCAARYSVTATRSTSTFSSGFTSAETKTRVEAGRQSPRWRLRTAP